MQWAILDYRKGEQRAEHHERQKETDVAEAKVAAQAKTASWRTWMSSVGSWFQSDLADKLGICLSGLCLIHCIILPVLILVLPSMHFWLEWTYFHDVMLVALPALALGAFVPGFRKHRNRVVFYWATPGLALIVMGTLFFGEHGWREVSLSILGSFLLIRAHRLNRHLCACCKTHASH